MARSSDNYLIIMIKLPKEKFPNQSEFFAIFIHLLSQKWHTTTIVDNITYYKLVLMIVVFFFLEKHIILI